MAMRETPPQVAAETAAPVFLRGLRSEEVFQCHRIDRAVFPLEDRWNEQTWHEAVAEYPALVAVQGGGIAGYVVYAFGAECVTVLRIAVHPLCQRCGVGTLLAGRVLELCATHGRSRTECHVNLTTSIHDLAALAFFKSLKWHGKMVRLRDCPTVEMVRFTSENRRK